MNWVATTKQNKSSPWAGTCLITYVSHGRQLLTSSTYYYNTKQSNKRKSCPNSHLTGALSLIWLVIIFTCTKYLNSD